MNTHTPPCALVIGLGASGLAATRLLQREGWRVTVTDRASAEVLTDRLRALPPGVEAKLGGHPVELLDDIALVVVSPGVAWDLPLLLEARRRGIETIAEVELAARHLTSVPILGVTGSNGKTTVTALLGEIARSAGLRTGVGGNIGTPACELALISGWDVVVLELSSFQLEGCSSLHPRVAALLNLSADHLDRHPTMDSYLAAKARVFARQAADDVAVLNDDEPIVAQLAVPAGRATFSLATRTADASFDGARLLLDGALLLPRQDLPLLGDHNVANALAAALVARRFGISAEVIAGALRRFSGLPHRHQVVAAALGLRWVDDSKGTNIGATAAGLAGYQPGTVHLILGGLGKGQDFRELRDALVGRVARVYLIGAAAAQIDAAIADLVPVEMCGSLEEAVRRAATSAARGDTVLLSPACASFDQFTSYAHRGDEFARLARAMAGGA